MEYSIDPVVKFSYAFQWKLLTTFSPLESELLDQGFPNLFELRNINDRNYSRGPSNYMVEYPKKVRFVQQIRSQWDKYYILWTKKFHVPYTCTIKTAKHLVILGLFQNASKLQNLKIAFLMSKICFNFWNSVEIIFFLSKKQTTKFSRRQKAWKYTKSKLTLNFFKKFISSCQNFCFSVRNVKG